MKRFFIVGVVSAALLGCAGDSGKISADKITTVLADGTRVFVLSVPAMT